MYYYDHFLYVIIAVVAMYSNYFTFVAKTMKLAVYSYVANSI